jgi:hypothetical protein
MGFIVKNCLVKGNFFVLIRYLEGKETKLVKAN